jgi:hypothetical protein
VRHPIAARLVLAVLPALFAGTAIAADPPAIQPSRFSSVRPGELPSGWQPLTFPKIARHTTYQVVADDGTTVVRADASGSASGLIHALEVDPRQYSIVSWRWKVANLIEKADATKKAGDDYPARIYVAFKYDATRVSEFDRAKHTIARMIYGDRAPHAAIVYVWENRLPVETVATSAYSNRVKVIVLRNRQSELGRWLMEERNVYEDYKRAFNEEPPPISGVAVMTDADDTGERATAWYGDIAFRKADR